MARIELDAFGEGTELVRVYLAAGLDEARRAEDVLAAAAVDFAVEVETFFSRTILGGGAPRQGAGFWLREADLDAACRALEAAGLVAGLVDRG
jgi:hypothetical protein